MGSFILTTIIMFVFWISLSGYFDAFHLISGLVSSLIIAFFSHDLLIGRGVRMGLAFRRFFRFLVYLPWLLKEILKSNLDVAWRTLHPSMPIDPRVFQVSTSIKTELGIVTFANSITLTPGTVTLAASRDGEFMVHAIAKGPADSLKEGEMARRVEAIEGVEAGDGDGEGESV